MPTKRKPKWLKWLDRYESLLVLGILALDTIVTIVGLLK